MTSAKHLWVITLLLCLFTLASTLLPNPNQPFAPGIEVARVAAASSCPDVVKAALQLVDKNCGSTGRNSVCYGNIKVEVEPQANAPKFNFAKPGDKAPLKNIHVLRLNSLAADAANWGIAVLRIQANLPDSSPGQNVTMLLFGNVQITDGSITAIHPTEIPTAFIAPPTLPASAATQAATSAATTSASISVTAIPSATATVGSTLAAYNSMQAFYFSSGIGEPSCKEAPEDGILIQSPQGSQKIDLLINEVRIVIGSTIFLQAQSGKELIVNTGQGSAVVSAFGETSIAQAGSRVRVPIDANLKASGPPSPPEPYDLNVMQPLPLQHLPQKVVPAAPIAAPPPGYTSSIWRVTFSKTTVGSGTAPGKCPATNLLTQLVTLAMSADGNTLWWGGGTFSGSNGSFMVKHNYQIPGTSNGAVDHFQNEIHFTSPTHGEGQSIDAFDKDPFCVFVVAYQLDRVGAA